MKARTNTLFSLTLAAGLAMLSFWLERLVHAPTGTQVSELRHEPDFIVERISATSLDRAGRPESTLTAREMRHFADDETSELDEPRLVQLRSGEPPVHVSADRGTLVKKGDEVQLYGNVTIRREATSEHPELRMETSYLQLFPKEDVARTPERVVILQGASRLSGIGMNYNNKTRQLELKASVSGTYHREGG